MDLFEGNDKGCVVNPSLLRPIRLRAAPSFSGRTYNTTQDNMHQAQSFKVGEEDEDGEIKMHRRPVLSAHRAHPYLADIDGDDRMIGGQRAAILMQCDRAEIVG